MFTRAFMRHFDKVKYRNPIEPFGQLTQTRIKFWPDIEVANMRLVAYVFTAYITYRVYSDPSVLFEMFYHPHYPTSQSYVYNRGIPKEIIAANEGPMAQLEKLQETAKLLASFDKNLIQTADVPAPVKENS